LTPQTRVDFVKTALFYTNETAVDEINSSYLSLYDST